MSAANGCRNVTDGGWTGSDRASGDGPAARRLARSAGLGAMPGQVRSFFVRCMKFIVQAFVVLAIPLASAGSYEDFFRAVAVDNVRGLRALLERGFDPNTPSEYGQVPLSLAIKEESFKAAELLLSHPSLRVDEPNASGETALMIAALNGRGDWVERLLARGAALNRSGWTPLHYAAAGPEPEIVRTLVERGAAIEARSPNGTTPLMMAAAYGDQRSAQYLLRRGADPTARNERGLAAADFARQAGRDALADQLDRAAARRSPFGR